MAEHEKGKKTLKDFIAGKEGDPTSFFNQISGGLNMTEPSPPTVNMPQMDSEEERFNKMVELNGKQYDNGDRSQGDQEAEQRMVQNKKTGLLQKFVDKIKEGFSEVKAGLSENPFNKALEKEFGTEDQPKYGGKDAVMYKGKFIHPDLYKMLMNRPDLEQRFDETGSIFGK